MDGADKIPVINIDYALMDKKIFIAKDLEDAQKIAKETNGMIFHDISMDKIVVIPGWVNQVSLKADEE